jgi:3-hydroxy-9,10-secoandrosta-1,3,5(10)-triene-9,17-dione monooxygenase reductase component
VSLDPMLVLFCVGKHSRTGMLMQHAAGFSVSILNASQQPLAAFFAGGWKEPSPPPFRFIPWTGAPRLEGCDAAIGCRVQQLHDAGDHWILVGQVVDLYEGPDSDGPLLFFKGHYRQIESENGDPARRREGMTKEPPIDPFESEAK